MKVTIKSVLVFIIVLLLGFGLGFWYKGFQSSPNLNKDPQEAADSIVHKEKAIIDSLTLEIRDRETIIDHLKDSIDNIKIIRIYKVDSIRKLPTSEGVEFLRTKLREFESKYQ